MTYDLIITHAWALVAGVLIGVGYCKFASVRRHHLDRNHRALA
jgi:hypothetical protein